MSTVQHRKSNIDFRCMQKPSFMSHIQYQTIALLLLLQIYGQTSPKPHASTQNPVQSIIVCQCKNPRPCQTSNIYNYNFTLPISFYCKFRARHLPSHMYPPGTQVEHSRPSQHAILIDSLLFISSKYHKWVLVSCSYLVGITSGY